ncbi:sugar transferase [Sulfuriferula multivorans]|uniref:Sugar transferase n=2 Tax=Sulfuriferula multivorans TaxID=1559896 RepID=A0A401JCN0_9PROT|nr:sugar transferase [Sulfuriferula multivorans]
MIRFFRHYIPAHLILIMGLDLAVMVASIYLGISVRFIENSGDLPASLGPIFPKASSFALVMMLIMTVFGMYSGEWMAGARAVAVRMIASFAMGFVVMSLLFYLFPDMLLGRGAFLFSLLFALIGITLTRIAFVKWSNLDTFKKRVLVLGSGSRAAKVDQLIKSMSSARSLQIVGYLPLQGNHHYVEHARVLHDTTSLGEIVTKYNIHEIVIAVRDRRDGGLPVSELLECKLRGINVIELSSFFERENGQLQLESLNASWIILSEGFKQGLARDTIKRIFDLVVSLVIMLISLPAMALTALAIYLESGGPVLYRQERVGQHGKPFTILKFRSMRPDAEQDGKPRWANKDDDRTTRTGRFIRRVRLDELPQLFNVFMGHMSFVGPRPERPYFVDELTRQIPYYNSRHTVKPGITGWAQVCYAYGASVEDAVEKLQYDLYYVKNHTLFLDMMVLFQTVQVVLWGKGQ